MPDIVIPLPDDEGCRILTTAQKELQRAVDAHARALRQLAKRMASQRPAKTGLARTPPPRISKP